MATCTVNYSWLIFKKHLQSIKNHHSMGENILLCQQPKAKGKEMLLQQRGTWRSWGSLFPALFRHSFPVLMIRTSLMQILAWVSQVHDLFFFYLISNSNVNSGHKVEVNNWTGPQVVKLALEGPCLDDTGLWWQTALLVLKLPFQFCKKQQGRKPWMGRWSCPFRNLL